MTQPSDNLQKYTEYKIEGKQVDEATFKDFTSEWKEVEGSYHCAKTIDGGRNSYEALDEAGVCWIYRCVMKGNFTSYSIDRN